MTEAEATALAEKRNAHLSRTMRLAGRKWVASSKGGPWCVKLDVPAEKPQPTRDSSAELRRLYAIGAAAQMFGPLAVAEALAMMKGRE